MHSMLILAAALGLLLAAVARAEGPTTQPSSPLSFTVEDNAGQKVDLSKYKGKVVLIVNTASKCGNTPQYAGLEKLYRQHKDQGLAIVAFPANDFGAQEPGSNQEIREFCTSKYDVTFDLFSKIATKGEAQAPLYKFLTDPATNGQFAGPIKWNFTKFLVGRNGQVVARFEPKVKPEDEQVTSAVEAELAKGAIE